jgi:hypothetical protein
MLLVGILSVTSKLPGISVSENKIIFLLELYSRLVPPIHFPKTNIGRDRMAVSFTTIYHHLCCEFESRSGRGVQNYDIMFVSDLRQVDGFLHQ